MAVHFSSVRLACAIFLLYRATASRGKCTELGDVHGSCASEVAQEIAETANTEEDGAWLLQIRGAGSDAELSVESTSEPCDKTGPNNMQKVSVPEVTNDVDAVCNDGTPAVYYWAPASCPDYEHKWLVFLGSGGWCWDFDSCAKRSTDSVSSKNYPDIDTPNPHSLFGNHSPFYSYNRVSLRQCSSDAWMGDLGANESIAKVNWRGARIVRSLLQHLVADRGLGNAKLLIFGGASAGGRGAMVHLDTLKKDGLVPRRVPVFGLLDSPYYIEMPPFRNLTMADHSLSLQTQLVAKNMHNEAILRGSGSCRLAEAWKCGFGQFRLSLLKTPFMLIHSQYDAYGISVLENITLFQQPGPDECFPEPQGAHYSFSGAYAGRIYKGLTTLPQVVKGKAGLYSTTCYQHAVAYDDVFGQQKLKGTSMAEATEQAVDAFMARHGPKKMPYIVDDTCAVFNCGQYCQSEVKSDCGLGPR